MKKLKKVSKTENQALEVTTFKLSKGHSFEQFVQANEDVDVWLKTKPGFQFRKMCLRDDGYVIDIVGWRTQSEGAKAGGQIMSELSQSIVHEMIDQRTVSWNVMPIGHAVDFKNNFNQGEK